MSNLRFREFYRRRLPHLQIEGGTYFITFRLKNSLPIEILERLSQEFERIKGLPGEKIGTEQWRWFEKTEILHSLKRHTARQSNSILKRSGSFWQDESYDHLIRDEVELERTVKYVLYNPVKAKLVKEQQEWQWAYCKYDM